MSLGGSISLPLARRSRQVRGSIFSIDCLGISWKLDRVNLIRGLFVIAKIELD